MKTFRAAPGSLRRPPDAEIGDNYVSLKPRRPNIHDSFINDMIYSYVVRVIDLVALTKGSHVLGQQVQIVCDRLGCSKTEASGDCIVYPGPCTRVYLGTGYTRDLCSPGGFERGRGFPRARGFIAQGFQNPQNTRGGRCLS